MLGHEVPAGGNLTMSNEGGSLSTPTSQPKRIPADPSGLQQSSNIESKFAVIVSSSSKVRRRTHSLPLGMAPPPAKRRPSRPSRQSNHHLPPNYSDQPPRTSSDESSDSEAQQPKRIGRPPIAETLARRAKEAKERAEKFPPKYIPFLCEWKACKAELHNLETLRKHIRTVHTTASSKHVVCQWGKCGLRLREFDDVEKLEKHVEKDHMISLAWHMGDGPRGSTIEDNNESDTLAYLRDAHGRIVTPSVLGQTIEYGSAAVNNARRIRLANQSGTMKQSSGGKLTMKAPPSRKPRSADPTDPTENFGTLDEMLQRQRNGEVRRWTPPFGILFGKTRSESIAILKSWGEPWLFDGSMTLEEQRGPVSANPIYPYVGQTGIPDFVGRDYSEWERQMGLK